MIGTESRERRVGRAGSAPDDAVRRRLSCRERLWVWRSSASQEEERIWCARPGASEKAQKR
jgi:hypothetical protein